MDNTGIEILCGMDDQTFCETLLTILAAHQDDLAHPTSILYQPWCLERLALVRERQTAIFYGTFLGPLRRRYPRQLFVGDLFQSMQASTWESQGSGGYVSPGAFEDAAMEYFTDGGKPGVEPGWRSVQQHYTVRPGEFTVLTGIASHLKSTWLQALCVNLARDAGWHIGIFSPEHAPLGELARALAECYTGLPLLQMPREMYADAVAWVVEHFHPIVAPEEVSPTLPWLLGVARQQVAQHSIKGLVLDPWNEIDHQQWHGQRETQYISEALSKVRRFARHHQAHVWLVAHPTKMQKAPGGRYAGKYPPPTPYDISGAAHWYNKADNCLCVWRDVQEDSPEIELHIQKVRYRAVGRVGCVELTYTQGRFHESDLFQAQTWTTNGDRRYGD